MSLLLNADQLTRMRDAEERSMPGSAVIYRKTETATGMGGMREAWNAIGTVPCDAWPMSLRGQEIVTGGQVTSRMGWLVSIPYGSDVVAKDLIEIDGRSFEVAGVPNDATWQTNLRLECITHNERTKDKG